MCAVMVVPMKDGMDGEEMPKDSCRADDGSAQLHGQRGKLLGKARCSPVRWDVSAKVKASVHARLTVGQGRPCQ